MNRFTHTARPFVLLALTAALSACSTFEESKIDYKSASQAPTLEIPPDLTQLRKDSRYQVSGAGSSSVSANATGGAQGRSSTGPDAGTATNQAGDARIERNGTQRWLAINRSADSVWQPLQDFWKDNGFVLITDQPELGIMETDWAENRAKLPQDFLRKALGKVMDSLYSTGERDRFRTRVERTATGGLEITITHRGMAEVYTNTQKDSTVWTPRAADPELEIEFLRRMMLRLGGSAEAATALAAKAAGASAPSGKATGVRVTTLNQLPAIEIQDGFDRAWRRVGVAIDRTGFTVEDRDRAQGVFFVRYAPPGTVGKEPGFFAKLFTSEKVIPTLAKYRIAVTSKGDVSTVSVQAPDGMPETSANAEKIIKLLADEIK
ncbi:MAG: outer membrane protein assembly factor BamC [Burkholderiales bacterium]|nr:outer membrane protein assembly factor BamC [Burkholderiales bacterium]